MFTPNEIERIKRALKTHIDILVEDIDIEDEDDCYALTNRDWAEQATSEVADGLRFREEHESVLQVVAEVLDDDGIAKFTVPDYADERQVEDEIRRICDEAVEEWLS